VRKSVRRIVFLTGAIHVAKDDLAMKCRARSRFNVSRKPVRLNESDLPAPPGFEPMLRADSSTSWLLSSCPLGRADFVESPSQCISAKGLSLSVARSAPAAAASTTRTGRRVAGISDYCAYRDPHSPLLYPQQMRTDPLPLFTPFREDTLVADGSA
jgi:hypothetical protein